MNPPVRFVDFPAEVQQDILDCVDAATNTMVTMLTVSQDAYDTMRPRLQSYLLEYGLERLVKKGSYIPMTGWKKYIFDAYPVGAIERQVMMSALFFLLGKYNKSSAQDYLYHFDPLIVDDDFGHIKIMGFMFNYHASTLQNRGHFLRTRRLVEDNAVIKHPLFAKMTLHTTNLKQVVEDRLEVVMKEKQP